MKCHTNGLCTLLPFILNICEAYVFPGSLAALHEGTAHTANLTMHPYFDFDVLRNVTTRVGQVAFLHCKVEHLGDKSVSWIRKRDLHILTAGISTYTSDERFQVIRPDKWESWTLQVKFPQLRDSGIYECQVNTEPKMSMAFRLNVVEAKAVILGPSDLYVKMGSSVTLTCIISQGPHDLGTIYWYRGSTLIETSAQHPNDATLPWSPRLSVEVEWTEALTSRLKIINARFTDSGNYSCVPTAAESASVMVNVINGEHPAAMQRGCAVTAARSTETIALLVVSLIFHYVYSVFGDFVGKRWGSNANTGGRGAIKLKVTAQEDHHGGHGGQKRNNNDHYYYYYYYYYYYNQHQHHHQHLNHQHHLHKHHHHHHHNHHRDYFTRPQRRGGGGVSPETVTRTLLTFR